MAGGLITPFAILLRLSGLSQQEAAVFLEVAPSSIDKMSRGVRSTPPGIMRAISTLIREQDRAAQAAIAQIAHMMETGSPDRVELGYPCDDHEAQSLGLPCVSAWLAMAARVIAGSEAQIVLVPRGSTPASAAATDRRESGKG